MEVTSVMCQKAIDYKKSVAGKFRLVEGAKISSCIAGEDFCVTRKIDGHLQVLFYENGQVVMLNSNGKQKAESLKCLDEFVSKVSAAGISSAVFAAELYLPSEVGRPRYGDVASALADENKRGELALAVFDVVVYLKETLFPEAVELNACAFGEDICIIFHSFFQTRIDILMTDDHMGKIGPFFFKVRELFLIHRASSGMRRNAVSRFRTGSACGS